MTNHRHVGLLLFVFAGIAIPGFLGCDKSSTGPIGTAGDAGVPNDGAFGDVPPGSFSKVALIGALAECAAGRYQAFAEAASALQTRITAYAGTLAPADLIEAQAAWRKAMAVWQEAEVFQLGPAASAAQAVGGQGLRLQIHSYPNVFRCGVDRRIVDQSYGANFASLNINVRGLGVLEYLLFHTGADNQCAAGDAINTAGTWAALDAPTLARRRADYAGAAITDVMARTQILLSAWAPGVANYRQDFVTAGAGSRVFATDHAALNAVSDGLLDYVDNTLKDAKVAYPSGIDMSACPTAPCTEALESPIARASTDNIVHNIIGVRRIFSGCGEAGAGLGFDDWLRAVGQGAVGDRMEAGIAAALTSAQTLDPPLEAAILVSPFPAARVQALHAAIKQFNNPLKADMFAALDLQRPIGTGTDND